MKWFLALLTFLMCLQSVHAEQSDEWMTFYYKKPSPEEVEARIREFVVKGHLKDQNAQPPIVGFLSEVMAQNPAKVQGWLKSWENLEEESREVLLGAAWMSDTGEARAYFKTIERDEFLKEQAPKILDQEVDNPSALDMLWGCFMATGDVKPIRKIVSAFELSKYAGALKRFRDSKKTEQDKKEAYMDVTFQAAIWSLESNCRQHAKVLEHCEKIHAEADLPELQKKWLGQVLEKVKGTP
jgi:hypothetical protein